jgi:hypothetical protein
MLGSSRLQKNGSEVRASAEWAEVIHLLACAREIFCQPGQDDRKAGLMTVVGASEGAADRPFAVYPSPPSFEKWEIEKVLSLSSGMDTQTTQ